MKKEYEITAKAGEFVAGRRIIGDDRKKPLILTDAEAAYEVQMQAIRPVASSAPVVDEPQPTVKAKGGK